MRSVASAATGPAPIVSVNQEAVRSLGFSMTRSPACSLFTTMGPQRARSLCQREAVPCHPALRVRIELDTAVAVEDHDRPVVGGVGGPVITRGTRAAERPPPPLHLVADFEGGSLVGGGGQQRAEPG